MKKILFILSITLLLADMQSCLAMETDAKKETEHGKVCLRKKKNSKSLYIIDGDEKILLDMQSADYSSTGNMKPRIIAPRKGDTPLERQPTLISCGGLPKQEQSDGFFLITGDRRVGIYREPKGQIENSVYERKHSVSLMTKGLKLKKPNFGGKKKAFPLLFVQMQSKNKKCIMVAMYTEEMQVSSKRNYKECFSEFVIVPHAKILDDVSKWEVNSEKIGIVVHNQKKGLPKIYAIKKLKDSNKISLKQEKI